MNKRPESIATIHPLISNMLSPDDMKRLSKYQEAFDFYLGYHWEGIPNDGKPQVTENYCRPFVNKFVAFEMGKGFTTTFHKNMKDKIVDSISKLSQLEYVNKVWVDNKCDLFCIEVGQMKSLTGDTWVKVEYTDDVEEDPFNEYPDGRIKLYVVPTQHVFAEYSTHDRTRLVKVTIMYTIKIQTVTAVLRTPKIETALYRQVWTNEETVEYKGLEEIGRTKNPYGVIPFVQIKNMPIAGESQGAGDLDDLIPLNVELNLKKSDVSEIIDYHSAPVTLIFGAKVSNLEKGANKVWGGLPTTAKVQNLELQGDLGASTNYINDLKTSMHEVGGVPKGALGGEQSISNTSGVALQYVNMPLIERTQVKKLCTATGLALVNKLILHISLVEGLITKPEDVTNYDFYYNEVTLPDNLPKDKLLELQALESELGMKIETRKGALERLGREDIDNKLKEVDEEQKKLAEMNVEFGLNKEGKPLSTNSGFNNGPTAV